MDFTTILIVLKTVSLALMIGNMAPQAPVPPPPPIPVVQEYQGPVLVYKD